MLADRKHSSFFNQNVFLKARTHRDEYRRTLFASVFQRVCCVHTQAIFADDEPSEHANSFPDIRWRLMYNRNTPVHKVVLRNFMLLTLACHSEEESKYLRACQNHTNLS